MRSTSLFTFLLLYCGWQVINTCAYYISPVRLTTDCRSNEVYFSCGNACEITCLNVTSSDQGKKLQPYVVLDQPCRYGCVGGCFCRGSLLRNRFGDCVEEHQCHPVHSRDSLVQQLNQLLGERVETERDSGSRSSSYSSSSSSSSQSSSNSNTKDQFDSFLDGFNVDKEINDHLDSLFNGNYPNNNLHNHHNGPNNVDNNGKIDTKGSSADGQSASVDDIEAFIEKETSKIIKRIHRGLRLKQFVKGVLRDLIQDSKYSDDQLKTESNKNGGLIKAKQPSDFP